MSALTLENLSVELGGACVLDGVSAAVEAGEWVTLIGPNGAGKTTLLRAVAGLVRAQGSIELDGVPLRGLARRQLAKRVALVPQIPVAPPEMTAEG